ncbi:hypothetical protein EJB05_08667, partial [Eragrostis curvula]
MALPLVHLPLIVLALLAVAGSGCIGVNAVDRIYKPDLTMCSGSKFIAFTIYQANRDRLAHSLCAEAATNGGFFNSSFGVGTDEHLGRMQEVPGDCTLLCEPGMSEWPHRGTHVKIISRLRHHNLVQLIGWCHSRKELLLVYQLMPNGSLDAHLYNDEKMLPWSLSVFVSLLCSGSFAAATVFAIISSAAATVFAVIFLQPQLQRNEQAETAGMTLSSGSAPHYCTYIRTAGKPSNVMLDESFCAKLGDFGLARLVDHGLGAHTTELAGTMGYMDPECMTTGRFSTESDMYSFGVVLLEIACGRRPVAIVQDNTVIHLAQRVLELHGNVMILDAADPRLNGDFDAQQMERVLVVGLWCTQLDRSRRPSIRQAISALRFETSLPTVTYTPPVRRLSSIPSFILEDSDATSGSKHLLRSSSC